MFYAHEEDAVNPGPAFSATGLPDAPSVEQQIAEDAYAVHECQFAEVDRDMAEWDFDRAARELARHQGVAAVLRSTLGFLRENCAAVS